MVKINDRFINRIIRYNVNKQSNIKFKVLNGIIEFELKHICPFYDTLDITN